MSTKEMYWKDRSKLYTITKNILHEGFMKRKPGECWECVLLISPISDLRHENMSLEKPFTHVIGDANGDMDRLIEHCMKSMRPDEESSFLCVQSSDKIEFNLKLLESHEKPGIFEWNDKEKLVYVERFKSQAVVLYRSNEIEQSFYKFQKALKLLLTLNSIVENEPLLPEVVELKLSLYNNLSSCHLYLKNFNFVIQLSDSVLSIQSNVKAFYRRSIAYLELNEFEKAENDLLEVLKLEPNNQAAKSKLTVVKRLLKESKEEYKNMVKKMFE